MAIKDLINTKTCLFICNGSCCINKNSEDVTKSIRKQIKLMNLDDDYHTVLTKCMGRCDDAPVAMLSPDNVWLKLIEPDNCNLLIEQIQNKKIELSKNFLYKTGNLKINSDSIPTKYRKNK